MKTANLSFDQLRFHAAQLAETVQHDDIASREWVKKLEYHMGMIAKYYEMLVAVKGLMDSVPREASERHPADKD